MESAIVLINCELGEEQKLLNALGEFMYKTPDDKPFGVVESHPVYGVYDIIAKVDAPTEEELKRIITEDIRKLDYVKTTITNMVADNSYNFKR